MGQKVSSTFLVTIEDCLTFPSAFLNALQKGVDGKGMCCTIRSVAFRSSGYKIREPREFDKSCHLFDTDTRAHSVCA